MRAYSGGYIGGKPTQNRLVSPGVWTMEEASELRRNTVWPTADAQDPAYDNTVLLLHGDGINNGTVFTDSSPVATSITATGDVVTSTTTQKFGTASILHRYLDTILFHFEGTNGTTGASSAINSAFSGPTSNDSTGTLSTTEKKFGSSSWYSNGSQFVLISPGSALNIGTADYTVEFWCKLDLNPPNATPLLFNVSYSSLTIASSKTTGRVTVTYEGAPSYTMTGNINIRDDTWHHVALCRQSNVTYLFIDGALDASMSNVFSISNNGQAPRICGTWSGGGGSSDKGYFDEFRFTPGLARYTSNFTPQSQAYANASALRIPTSPSLAFGTGDFTIETWVYSTVSQTATIYDGRNGSEPNTIQIHLVSSQPYLAINGVNVLTTATALTTNAWTHLAVCRRNGSTRIFVNGVQASSTYTDANDYVAPSVFATIGSYYDETNRFQGYIDEFRILKNSGVYTSAFVPSSYPYGDTQIDDPYFNYGTLLLPFNAGTEADPNFANVSLLLRMEGLNSSTSFSDSSNNGLIVTPNGNVQISTTQSKYGNSSAIFDGSGDYLSIASTTLTDLPADFTIEAWLRPASLATGMTFLGKWGSGNRCWLFSIDNANQITFVLGNNGGISGIYARATPTTLTANTWYHIAACRSGSTTKLFVDGVQAGANIVDSGNNSGTQVTAIGINTDGNVNGFNGYIDSVRITKGFARYTANFTPPTSDFLDSGTLVAFTDFSYLNHRVIAGGNATFSTAQSRTGGASVYFNGSNAYLDLANPSASNIISSSSGDFTLEFWFLSETNTGDRCLYESYASASSLTGISITNDNLLFYVNTGSGDTALITTTAPVAGSWYYLTLERVSTTINLFIDGGLVGTCASVGLPAFSSGSVRIGSNNSNTKKFQGYIDELRMTDNLARYRTPFLRPQYANWYPTPALGNDASFANVRLLCQFDSTPIIDNSSNALTITGGGSPLISSTASVNRYSGSSLYLNGSSYLSIPQTTATDLAGFTIEAWVRPMAFTGTMTICGKWGPTEDEKAWIFQIVDANTLLIQTGNLGNGRTTIRTTPFTMAVGAWYHIAAVRNYTGATSYLFLNGIQCGTGDQWGTLTSATGSTFIGVNGSGLTQYFNGYIDSLRITNSTNRYTPGILNRPQLSFPNS